MKAIIIYYVIISLIAAVLTVHDKHAAIIKKRRVPERTLFLFAALGGALLMYITMLLIRHKTRHASFMIGLLPIILLHVLILVVVAEKLA